MKLRLSGNREAAMTLLEIGMVFALVVVLAVVFLPMLSRSRQRSLRNQCVNNQKCIILACKVWSGDSMVRFPTGVSITNGGSMEMVQTGNVVQTFLAMSNELGGTTKFLLCPADTGKFWTNTFTGFSASNVSYFVSADVTNDDNPQMILSGDCNFEVGGKPVKSGLNSFWTNDYVAWQPTRHIRSGNLGFADGSVQSTTSASLQNYLQQTGFDTNRFAIP
ncbi:MAG TPA: hypothetical protein VK742_06400 [Candidatus Sulfotelmatobacter sp.]|jgi:prepilin-type processing-associated H-X9-DG protein|nr:hypothetical protein [Candidatus Sulfotelmatobacter sp.]